MGRAGAAGEVVDGADPAAAAVRAAKASRAAKVSRGARASPPAAPARRPPAASTVRWATGAPARPTPDGGLDGAGDARPAAGGGAGDHATQPPTAGEAPETDEGDDTQALAPRRGRERRGRPVGRYLMCVHVEPDATQIAVLEGRALVEHYVARPQDDAQQIIGNIYRGRVKNVLPGMEAAFVDIGTPKNAVLYWGDVSFDRDDDRARSRAPTASSTCCGPARRSSARSRRTRSA